MLGIQCQIVIEPSVLLAAGDDQVSHLLRAELHAVHLNVRELLHGNLVDSSVDSGQFTMSRVDAIARVLDFVGDDSRVELRKVVDDRFDGGLELPHSFLVASHQRHGQGADLLGNLGLQYVEGVLTLGRYEHLAPCGQVVADDVGNRVGLAGARGALDHHAGRPFEHLDNGFLLLVVGQREKELTRLALLSGRSAQASERNRLVLNDVVGRRRHQRDRAWRNHVTRLQPVLQPFDVHDKVVVRANPREQHPTRCHKQVRLGRGKALIGRVVSPLLVEVASGELQDGFDARDVERRHRMLGLACHQQLGLFLYVGRTRELTRAERVKLQPRFDRTRPDRKGVSLTVEIDLNHLGQKRVLEVHSDRTRAAFRDAASESP